MSCVETDSDSKRHCFTIDLLLHISSEEARLLLRIKLYEAERISLGKAAELAGYEAGVHGAPSSLKRKRFP